MAIAWTSLMRRPRSAAMRAQSSNSGAAFSTRPSRLAILKRIGADAASRSPDLAVEAVALHLLIPHADRRRLARTAAPTAPRAGPGGAMTVTSVPGPVLLHLHRRVEHVERARPRAGDPSAGRTAAGSCRRSRTRATTTRSVRRAVAASPTRMRSTFGRPGKIAVAGAVADAIAAASPAAARSCARSGHEQRAGRRHQLGGDRPGRRSARPSAAAAVAGAGTGNVPCAHCTVPLPTFSGEATMSIDAEPLHAEHRADDVDDRVERADFVQVDALERHRRGSRPPPRRAARTAAPRASLPAGVSAERPIAAAMSSSE